MVVVLYLLSTRGSGQPSPGLGSAAASSGSALDTSSWDLTLHRTFCSGLLDPALSCKHAGHLFI